MKTPASTHLLCCWILLASFFLAHRSHAQTQDEATSVQQQALVMFQPGAVMPPPGQPGGHLDLFQVPSPTLRQALRRAGVQTLYRVLPDFQPEDRFVLTEAGEEVELTDWSRLYVLHFASPAARDRALEVLEQDPGVSYAEANGLAAPDIVAVDPAVPLLEASTPLLLENQGQLATIPNDPNFYRQWGWKNDGTSAQGSGTVDADVDAELAWDITTSSSSIKIAIVDVGMQTNHPDFTGRVTGDAGDNTAHGTAVAGIAAAKGNNSLGVAGLAWNVGIINEVVSDIASVIAAIESANNRGAHILNNSRGLLPLGQYSSSVRQAFGDAYKLNKVAVVSMGNTGMEGNIIQYPAAFGQGIITVGATTNTDVRADYSTAGAHIDVSAPGGGGLSSNEDADYWYSTVPGSTYGYYIDGLPVAGTSFSTPIVTGLAALLLSVNASLYNDDIEQIIRLGAEDKGSVVGFDTLYGTGRVNAKKTLDLIRSPYVLRYYTATSGVDQGAESFETMEILGASGLANGFYQVKKHEMRFTVAFSSLTSPNVWGRGNGSVGWSQENPNVALNYCDVVPGTVTSTGATVRTYVYEVYNLIGQFIGYYPSAPSGAKCNYTAHGIPPPLTASISGPSSLNSGQAGTWTSVVSGGQTPYTYRWDYLLHCPDSEVPQEEACDVWKYGGSAASFTKTTIGNWTLEIKLTVTDARNPGQTATATKLVTIGTGSAPLAESSKVRSDAGLKATLPLSYALQGNYPNPFNPTTEIPFALPEAASVSLVVYDVLGREVTRLQEGLMEAGYHRVRWDASSLPSGVYLVQFKAGPFTAMRRLVLAK